ncbi:MAG: UbiA family prenyltransferase, partial [Candidatus Methylumidiphilus sp.]
SNGLPIDPIPLAVDLDGTLIKTDILVESFILLVKRHFWKAFLIPLWLTRGKAYLKEQIALCVDIDAKHLPYHAEFLGFLVAEHEKGRKLVLATASHRRLAAPIATHLGIFDAVLATEYPDNLSGAKKRDRLIEQFGEKGFDYAGNGLPDLKIWPHSRKAILVSPNAGVEKKLRAMASPDRVFPKTANKAAASIRALRPHQWVKNTLIFVPLLAAHLLSDQAAILHTLLAFMAFCCAASSAYILNDLLDLSADREHPRKRNRPFASGQIQATSGFLMALVLFASAFGIASALPGYFLAISGIYYIITLAYSFKLKTYAMLDVLSLAGLYTLRIIAGAAAIPSMPSFWLLAFSMFMFLSLALVKRYSELLTMRHEGKEKTAGRGYQTGDLIVLMSAGLASGYLAVLVLAMYINSPQVQILYKLPEAIWIICPIMLYWISRIWMITHRGDMPDDPIVFTFRDKVSLIIGVVCAGVMLVAT